MENITAEMNVIRCINSLKLHAENNNYFIFKNKRLYQCIVMAYFSLKVEEKMKGNEHLTIKKFNLICENIIHNKDVFEEMSVSGSTLIYLLKRCGENITFDSYFGEIGLMLLDKSTHKLNDIGNLSEIKTETFVKFYDLLLNLECYFKNWDYMVNFLTRALTNNRDTDDNILSLDFNRLYQHLMIANRVGNQLLLFINSLGEDVNINEFIKGKEYITIK